MQRDLERVIVIGAGPVGLCLALALAQQDVRVTVIEALHEDNFLEQVPRALEIDLGDRVALVSCELHFVLHDAGRPEEADDIGGFMSHLLAAVDGRVPGGSVGSEREKKPEPGGSDGAYEEPNRRSVVIKGPIELPATTDRA